MREQHYLASMQHFGAHQLSIHTRKYCGRKHLKNTGVDRPRAAELQCLSPRYRSIVLVPQEPRKVLYAISSFVARHCCCRAWLVPQLVAAQFVNPGFELPPLHPEGCHFLWRSDSGWTVVDPRFCTSATRTRTECVGK